jgi:ArsR family transcriptional regulator, lead/cadmium/zinc/bismuth-responsive transcriptional repressor
MSQGTTIPKNLPKQMAALFRILGQPARLRILLALGSGEACVCHLETALKMRQAYISQHLMALREARLVDSRRDGRNIYYRLRNPALLDVIQEAGKWYAGDDFDVEMYAHQSTAILPGCICPRCTEAMKPDSFIAYEDISLNH